MQKNSADAMPNKIINNFKKKRPYLTCLEFEGSGGNSKSKISSSGTTTFLALGSRETYRISSMWLCEYTNAFNYL